LNSGFAEGLGCPLFTVQTIGTYWIDNLSNAPLLIRHTIRRTNALTIVPKGENLMQFALLVYELPEAFAARNSDGTDPYTGAWRAYHKALVESGAYLAGDPLEVPETGTTVRLKDSGWSIFRQNVSPYPTREDECLFMNTTFAAFYPRRKPPSHG
jgi:hypothetical protein